MAEWTKGYTTRGEIWNAGRRLSAFWAYPLKGDLDGPRPVATCHRCGQYATVLRADAYARYLCPCVPS